MSSCNNLCGISFNNLKHSAALSIFDYSNKKSGTFSEVKICLKNIHHENDQRKLSNATQQLARRAEV